MQKVLIRMYLALFSGGAAQEKSPSLALAGQPGTVNSLDQAQMRDPLFLSLRFNGGGAQQRASPLRKPPPPSWRSASSQLRRWGRRT